MTTETLNKFWDDLDRKLHVIYEPDGNRKGTFCPYDENKFCQEGICKGCQIYLDALSKADKELGLCPVCGCDVKVWAEMFGEEHYCDPTWEVGKVVR